MITLPKALRDQLSGRGFDLPKLKVHLFLAIAAYVALLLARSLGLDHPQWAAITVLVTALPSRGQMIEKNIYRLLGTLVGAGTGIAILKMTGGTPLWTAVALTLFSGVCLFLGNLQRSFRSYGTVLAGYTAIIVAMADTSHPELIADAAMQRSCTIFVGLFVGILAGIAVFPSTRWDEMRSKTRSLLADMLHQSAINLQSDEAEKLGANYRLTVKAAELMAQIAALSAGRFGGMAQHPLDEILVCATNLLLATAQSSERPEMAQTLNDLAARLHGQDDFEGIDRALGKLLAKTDDPGIEAALLSLMTAIPAAAGGERAIILSPKEGWQWQYDLRSARDAALRIMMVTGGIGALWVITGAQILQFALISSAIVVSLSANGVMRDVIIGQLMGASAALFCEMVLWAHFPSPTAQIITMLPICLAYGFIKAHGKTTLSATDYVLTSMLLLTPELTDYHPEYPPLAKAALAATGGVIGYVACHFLFPMDARHRRKMLWAMIKKELQEIALASHSRATANTWRLRFVGRFMRISHWAAHEGHRAEKPEITMRKSLLTLALGDLVFGCKAQLRRNGLSPSLRRTMETFLARVGMSQRENEKLIRILKRLHHQLLAEPSEHMSLAHDAKELLEQLEQLQLLRKAPLGS